MDVDEDDGSDCELDETNSIINEKYNQLLKSINDGDRAARLPPVAATYKNYCRHFKHFVLECWNKGYDFIVADIQSLEDFLELYFLNNREAFSNGGTYFPRFSAIKCFMAALRSDIRLDNCISLKKLLKQLNKDHDKVKAKCLTDFGVPIAKRQRYR